MILNNKNKYFSLALPRAFTFSATTQKTLLALSTVVLLTTTSFASEVDSSFGSGFYAGFALTNIDAEDSGISTSDMGAALIGGYSFSQYLSTEVSVFTIGDHKALGMKGNGLSVGVIGSYPVLDNFSLFAELGVMSVDVAIDETVNPVTVTATEEDILQDGIDTSMYMSLGATYRLNDWSVAMKMSLVDLDADLNILSLQANYHF